MNKKPIKILHIVHDLQVGGLQAMVLSLCCGVDKEIYEVSVLCLRGFGHYYDKFKEIGISVNLLKQSDIGTDYFSFLKVGKFLKKNRFDIIHTHNTQPLIDAVLGSIFLFTKNVIIHTEHGRQFPDKKRYMLAEYICSHFIAKYICVSECVVRDVISYEKISSKKIYKIENCIDGKEFRYCQSDKLSKHNLGIPDENLIVGVVCRLEKVKGVDLLINIFPDVLKMFPNVTLLVVGDGSQRDDLYRLCLEKNIVKNVIFTGFREDIPGLLNLLDVYVLPSISEGLPLGLLEAMASGCSIVASSTGSIPDILQNGFDSLVFNSGSASELYNALVSVLHDDSLRFKLSTNARKTFTDKFDLINMLNSYHNVYMNVSNTSEI